MRPQSAIPAVVRRWMRDDNRGMDPLGEFELIARYFTRPVRRAALGIGDDCALLDAGAGHAARGVERPAGRGPAFRLDGRARPARPQGAGRQPVATSPPAVPRRWRSRWRWRCRASTRPFSTASRAACYALADAHGIELVGGDTTAGPLAICITVFGEVPAGRHAAPRRRARRRRRLGQRHAGRCAARARGAARHARAARRCVRARARGDGDAAAARRARPGAARHRIGGDRRLRRPARRPRATCWRARGVGATVDADAVPASAVLAALPRERCAAIVRWPAATTTSCCSPRRRRARDAVLAAARDADVRVTRIGCIDAEPGLRLVDADGRRARRPLRVVRPLPHMNAALAAPSPSAALSARASGAPHRARLRQRPVARRRRAPSARCGPGSSSRCSTAGSTRRSGPASLALSFALGWWACTRTARDLGVRRSRRHRLGRGRSRSGSCCG